MHQEVSSRTNRTILCIASLMGVSIWAPMICVPPMEHILKEELLLTHAQASLLFTIPVLMLIVMSIPGGLIADRIGVRKAAGIGIIIIALGTVLRGTANSASSLVAFTFIYGVGVGLSFPNLPKLISLWIPKEKATLATGVYASATIAGEALVMATTMPLIFPLTNTFQGVFYIWSIPPIVTAVLWWVLIREPPHEDIPGELVTRGNVPFHQILRNKNLWLVAILRLLFQFLWNGWAAWVPALMMLKGATEDAAGVIGSIFIWAGIPTVLLMPRLSYKVGLKKPFIWVPAIALALVAWGAMYISIPLSWPFMVLVGVALNTQVPMVLALPIEMMSKEEVGRASGLIFSVSSTGGFIGPLIGGYILDLTGSLDQFLLVLVGVSVAAAAIAFRIPETGSGVRSVPHSK
jgi:cyanate permease